MRTIRIPLSKFFKTRRLLLGCNPMNRAILQGVVEKLDAAGRTGEHVVISITEDERQAAAGELAGAGSIDGKLCLLFAEPANEVPTWQP